MFVALFYFISWCMVCCFIISNVLLYELAHNPQVLVNNAGITRDTLAMRMKADQWQQVGAC